MDASIVETAKRKTTLGFDSLTEDQTEVLIG